MYRLTSSLILLLAVSMPTIGQSFFDDFDGKADPSVAWAAAGPGTATTDIENSDLILKSSSMGDCCLAYFGALDHEDLQIEATFRFPEANDFFVGTGFRQVADDGVDESYWVGAYPTGEIFIGYTDPAIRITQSGMLPTGPIAAGTDVSYLVDATGNKITFTAWQTNLGRDQAATISWTDPLDRNPTGDLVYPFINPQGNQGEIRVRSFGASTVPEPRSLSGLSLGAIFVLSWRRRRS